MTLLALTAFLYSLILLADSYTGTALPASRRALLASSVLFMLCLVNIQASTGLIFLKILVGSCIEVVSSLFRSSNHFVVTLKIITFFSMMMLIYYHNLKIEKTLLVK